MGHSPGPYIVVVGEVYDHTNAADFGRTLHPRECSAGKTLGEKGLSTARLLDAPCAGKVVAQATAANYWPTGTISAMTSDVVVVLYDPATGDVHRIRRTGISSGSFPAFPRTPFLPTCHKCRSPS